MTDWKEVNSKRKEYLHNLYLKNKAYIKKYQSEHKEEAAISLKKYRLKIRLKTIKLLGGVCIKCGFSDWRALQVDHIDGGGNTERKSLKSQSHFLKLIKENPSKYQLLCANCNWIKRYENEEYKLAF